MWKRRSEFFAEAEAAPDYSCPSQNHPRRTIPLRSQWDLLGSIGKSLCCYHRSRLRGVFRVRVQRLTGVDRMTTIDLGFSAPAIQKEKDKPLEELHCLTAHTGNCICLEFDASGKYFAVGAADASASIWDVSQLACLTVLTRWVLWCEILEINFSFRLRIEWAVRGLSFGCQSQLIALASEDPYIEIAKVDTGNNSPEHIYSAESLLPRWTCPCIEMWCADVGSGLASQGLRSCLRPRRWFGQCASVRCARLREFLLTVSCHVLLFVM